MRAAAVPVQRPVDARLLHVDAMGRIEHLTRLDLPDLLRPGDLLVANDAATIPASLRGVHGPTGRIIEVRLAARRSLAFEDVRDFTAIVFGEGDHRTRTEDRPLPPEMRVGDALVLGPLEARVTAILGHPRLLGIRFKGAPERIWAGIAIHGRPIQYAHVRESLALWDVWTRLAAVPAAFEPPSAGFALDWDLLERIQDHGIGFATLTHAAGISSTGDASLDAALPFDEPYDIPAGTVSAIRRARRVVAVGTSVTRALEHAASRAGGVRAEAGVARGRIGAATRLRVVDAIVTGAHEPGESHYELLRAFASEVVLARMTEALETNEYRTHEYGDWVLLEGFRGRPRTGSSGWTRTNPNRRP